MASPAYSIGTPWDSSSMARKFRFCLARRAWILESALGPSAPQFQLGLLLLPSRFSSPLTSLCFSLYLTRPSRGKPPGPAIKLLLPYTRPPLSSHPPPH